MGTSDTIGKFEEQSKNHPYCYCLVPIDDILCGALGLYVHEHTHLSTHTKMLHINIPYITYLSNILWVFFMLTHTDLCCFKYELIFSEITSQCGYLNSVKIN